MPTLQQVRCVGCGRRVKDSQPTPGAYDEIRCTCKRLLAIRDGVIVRIIDR